MESRLLAGVIEGFYGQPWTPAQRLRVISKLAAEGLNTYFYAPKDDLKHRAIWREEYDASELARISELITACDDAGIRFIYGLSPGLDVRFSEAQELAAIQRRFDQLRRCNARWFALLFDDLPGEMNQRDAATFGSLAVAQSELANRVHAGLQQADAGTRLFFCPTPYCDRMDRWQLGGTNYLDDLGANLHLDVDVFWTGPEIVSREIPVSSVQAIVGRLKRPPILWDNLHANDYDLRRLYCGPYSGRDVELKQHVRGILINPNNEFSLNEVPIRTLAKFVTTSGPWEPRKAYLSSLADWLPCYQTIGPPIKLDDLILLADCYYLPFEQGEQAQRLFDDVELLVSHPTAEWGEAHQRFVATNLRVQKLFEALTQLRDRELFYAWSRRAWELKEELDLFASYFERRLSGVDADQGISSESHLPHTYRGGITARLQQLLSMTPDGRFYANSINRR